MNGSPFSSDDNDTFQSCRQSIASASNNDEESAVFEPNNVVRQSQDSNGSSDATRRASSAQEFLTQVFPDDDDDENDSDAFHTAAGSMNPEWQQSSSLPGTQESQPEDSGVEETDESQSEASPEKSVNSTITTPDDHNTRRRRRGMAAPGWIQPDLLSTTTMNTRRSKRKSNVESVVEEKKASESPPDFQDDGWPTMDRLGSQQSASNSGGVASSSPESTNGQMDTDGSTRQYSPDRFLTQYDDSELYNDESDYDEQEVHNDIEQESLREQIRSPMESRSSQPTFTDSKIPAASLPSSPDNSQASNGFVDTSVDSSPEKEPQHFSPTTPLQASPFEKESDGDSSACEKKDLTRDERIKRNRDRLVALGLAPPESSATPMNMHSSPGEALDTLESPTGMLLSSSYSPESKRRQSQDCSGNIDALYERYPHREAQIQMLVSLIGTTMGQTACQGIDPYVPPPIFVSGPSGSGKTSIVRDTVETLRHYYLSSCGDRVIRTAYVNCAAVEPSSLEAVLESAYSQLVPAEELSSRRRPGRAKRLKKRKAEASTCDDDPSPKHFKAYAASVVHDEALPNEDLDMFVASNDGDQYNSGNESEMEDLLEASKSQVEVGETKVTKAGVGDSSRSKRITRHSTNGSIDRKQRLSSTNVPNARKKTIKKSESVTKSHGAPVAFGRVIAPLFGSSLFLSSESKPGSAFLVLDHAERLFTLSTSQKREPNNFLAQLLLLPKVMGLNLTIIVVSRSTLLDSSRINNSASVQKALGSVANGICPVRVHFPAYRGKAEFKTILSQPSVVQLIVGESGPKSPSSRDGPQQSFRENTIDSFVETVVQSLSSVTRDTREMVRISRSLWPTYILPLDPGNIRTTLATARQRMGNRKKRGDIESVLVRGANSGGSENVEDLQKEILSILDEAILPRMKKCLEEELFVMKGIDIHGSQPSPTPRAADLSFLSKCLLLAAFVCQSNKPDKDKTLFTIQKNGKKNNRHGHRVGSNDSEGLAFGSTTWEQQRLKMLRPRTFPLERMLSVFVNIVGLIGGEDKLRSIKHGEADTGDILSSIGSTCFFDNLARLRDIGLLHEVQGPSVGGGDGFTSFDGINMISTKYWCELSLEEAEAIAASVDFSLANFLL